MAAAVPGRLSQLKGCNVTPIQQSITLAGAARPVRALRALGIVLCASGAIAVLLGALELANAMGVRP